MGAVELLSKEEKTLRQAPSDLGPSPDPNPLVWSRFVKFVWISLLYNLLTVAWGVYVRATKSGDGCGSHWPLCDGESTPLMGPMARVVEASHRVTGAITGLLALILIVWAWRAFPKGSLVRKASAVAFGMAMLEALIGMALVKFKLVTDNDSAMRAGVMAFHVISTFFLVGAIAVAGLAAAGAPKVRWKGQGAVGWMLGIGGLSLCFLGVSGAISALGHTLKPTDNVIQAALNPATHWMVRLQPLHPLIAVAIGLYLVLLTGLLQHLRPDARVAQAAKWMVGLYVLQLALGVLNIWLKAPVWMQMAHLVLADINWISLVAVGAFALGERVEHVEKRAGPSAAELPLGHVKKAQAYLALTKPRVISLLLLTTLASMFAAEGGWPGGWLFLAVGVGGYMAAGAANAINMVIDSDIDHSMKRTCTRPTVTQSISSGNALLFSCILAAGSFSLLWVAANLLTAVLAFTGLVFYVVVYTMMLKRRTWQNIVIGGAAGAIPPLVGWAAVSNSLPPLALTLFFIIFFWTPVHFWALALLLKEEYAAAGVPMLPVVRGDRSTINQILGYMVVTVAVTMIPLMISQVGWIYTATAILLNAVLLERCWRLHRRADRPHASSLFHYSMLYLAILFVMLAVDRSVLPISG